MCLAPCHDPCFGSFYIYRTFDYICMTKLKPGVRPFLGAPVAAYQYLLVSPSITHYCVGNDSSFSFSVFCFGQLSRLLLPNWSPYGGLWNYQNFFTHHHRYHLKVNHWRVWDFDSQLNVYAIWNYMLGNVFWCVPSFVMFGHFYSVSLKTWGLCKLKTCGFFFFLIFRYNMSTDVFLIYYISTVPVQCVIVKKIKYGCLVQLMKPNLSFALFLLSSLLVKMNLYWSYAFIYFSWAAWVGLKSRII